MISAEMLVTVKWDIKEKQWVTFDARNGQLITHYELFPCLDKNQDNTYSVVILRHQE